MTVSPQTKVLAADRYFTSHEVAKILQVTPSSIVKWVKDGKLPAFQTPGRHRRIAAADLVQFAETHGLPIPDELRDLAASSILVIDDDKKCLASIEKTFKPHASSFHLHTSDDGIKGLLLLGALRPDVLIFDVQMKQLDGLEVLQRVRANPETAHTVVIAIGTKMDAATAARCTKLGAALCLQKPLNQENLLESLRSLRKVSRGG